MLAAGDAIVPGALTARSPRAVTLRGGRARTEPAGATARVSARRPACPAARDPRLPVALASTCTPEPHHTVCFLPQTTTVTGVTQRPAADAEGSLSEQQQLCGAGPEPPRGLRIPETHIS